MATAHPHAVPLGRLGRDLRTSPALLRLGTAGFRAASLANRRRAISSYLRTAQVRRLAVGAGTHVRAGWLSTDLSPLRRETVFLDACKRFPLPTGSFDRVHCEHLIEHISYSAAERMLRECRRVMTREGVIRVATPDLARFAKLLVEQPNAAEMKWIKWSNERDRTVPAVEVTSAAHAVNRMAREWGHTFIYDEGALARLLLRCGFKQVIRTEVNRSEFLDLRDLERHGDEIGETQNEFETMVLEARAAD